jgi:hypothetical protein
MLIVPTTALTSNSIKYIIAIKDGEEMCARHCG